MPHPQPDTPNISPAMASYAPRALFAISSLGLGHATRSLVVVREYLRRGYHVTLISTGNALSFLRLELEGENGVELREMADYPPLERGTGWRLYYYLVVDLLKTWRIIRREHRAVKQLSSDYDFIFSDGRYGFHSRWTPSFVLSHQIAFMPPKGLRETSWLTEHVNIVALRRFDRLFIPDYPYPNANLSGNLAHTPNLHRCRHSFIGVLSSYPHLSVEQDIDYLFIVSGYLLEHKGSFICSLLEQAGKLPGRKVFVLGNAQGDSARYDAYRRDDLEIHAVASGRLRQELFNRARCIISRAGYTTVMDLVEHDKRALLIPTPNQTEQEYLAYYLSSLDHFTTRDQNQADDLIDALKVCQNTRLFEVPWRTEESVRRIDDGMAELLRKNFISIIVPAHNEQDELAATLRSLLAQRYPPERMEIIVVENGSTDATPEIAQRIAEEVGSRGRIHVLQSEKGVSRAKNAGLAAVSPDSEWIVFCDADTRLGPNFLHHLNTWLNRHSNQGLSVGTTSVRPQPSGRFYARAWFSVYDLIHRLTKTSYAIQLARTPVARGIGFREDLHFAEDLIFIRECRHYGRFFYVFTDQVATSTRRFEANGYLRQGLRWVIEALMPMRLKAHRKYDVIR